MNIEDNVRNNAKAQSCEICRENYFKSCEAHGGELAKIVGRVRKEFAVNGEVNTKHTPGVFKLMAEYKSFEIAQWLETTPPNVARALFETGARVEGDRRELLETLEKAKYLLAVAADHGHGTSSPEIQSARAVIRAAIAKATGGAK